ncbi:phage tail protein [Sorangium sp. So ce131]|uniref:phage tail protein n=1 Tax=Sorangium sp. So ce131 TaxID=3133282 RepID=UPI003F5DCE93
MTEETNKKMPFGFEVSYELFNARGERLRDTLLLENPGAGHTLRLDIENLLTDEAIVLRQRPTAGEVLGAHHFRLRFAAGALAARETRVVGADWDIRRVDREDGATDVYLAWRSPDVRIAPGDRLMLLVQGLYAAPDAGTEVIVDLSWPALVVPEGPDDPNVFHLVPPEGSAGSDCSLAQQLALGVRDRRGRPDIPLRARFEGSNQVINIATTPNTTLTLRLVNSASPQSQEILRFHRDPSDPAKSSRLVVALPVETAEAQPWALGYKSFLERTKITLADWTVSGPTLNADGDLLEWELTPTKDVTIAPRESLTLTLSDMATTHPSGTAYLELRYSAVPGYSDGEILCPVEKSPIHFGRVGTYTNVGIGHAEPSASLHLHRGDMMIDTGEIQHGNWFMFRAFQKTHDDNPVAQFSHQDALLMTLSRLGKLRLHAPYAELHGAHALTFRADVEEGDTVARFLKQNEAVPLMELLGDGTLRLLRGRFKDDTGFVVPVGTVVAYAGTAPPAPEGWLMCDGAEHDSKDHQELSDLLGTTYGDAGEGKFRVPDLSTSAPAQSSQLLHYIIKA